MTEEQIRERNIAIAKFLQLGNVGTGQIRYAVILEGKAVGYYLPENLKFHKSWDWLMPVIRQLYQKGDPIFRDSEAECKSALCYEPIEEVHKIVYQWIQKINDNEGLA